MHNRTPDGVIAPQQQRSRDTLARLLKATTEALETHGLDGATIPRIAAAAGVAPASIYRRFRDRNALVRAALVDALETGATARQTMLRLEAFPDRTLEGVVRGLVAITARQYRAQPGLMRALTRFIETDTDDEFRSRALALVAGNFQGITDLLLAFRDEIAAPDPRRAIMFALLTMATVIEVRALETVSMWHELMPVSDQELEAEVTRTVLAYLRLPAR
ncbi:regulatory protein TetR (plasmid) [Gemmatirosa kalamazoonensis]|uniref:Regulatory protein TetR n=1 Tax=Gemmatirosa kalamazoonensis TaxID=861299 RepID=W0RSM5_9BACT|nr:TetR family transcriptional regulator [Gemmatirosa kalamazoonensis]AHG93305.1 regulatory protein TetR [Gemmatirosa kalamazoonensis]